jgi:putative peptidoglycan lipid II flippase
VTAAIDSNEDIENTSRNTIYMAAGTALSRVTGLMRIFALAYALGFGALADSYNLSNTLPNIIHDLVLGGVLSATFVPVFVEYIDSKHETTEDDISAIVTTSIVLLAVASLLFLVLAPYIANFMDLYAASGIHKQELPLTIDLLRLFTPQLACYGLFGLITSLLNAHRKFTLPAFAPIANNISTIAVLIAFGLLARNPNAAWLSHHTNLLMLLGLGTTFGILLQLIILLPGIRSLHLRLRWNPSFLSPPVKKIAHLGAWILGFVIANQVSLLIVLMIAQHLEVGAVSAYTYAYSFFQVPFGIITVSIMGTAVPALASSWLRDRVSVFSKLFSVGLMRIIAIVIPAMAVEVITARPLIALLLGHGAGNFTNTAATGEALAMLALGLPGFSIFMYCMATFQSIQRMKTVFILYLIQNCINVGLALSLPTLIGLRGLMLSIALSYDIMAIVALIFIAHRLLLDDFRFPWRTVVRICVSTVFMSLALAAGLSMSGSNTVQWLIIRVGTALAAGALVYLLISILLGMIDRRMRHV